MKMIWEDMDVFEATDNGARFLGICLGRPEVDRYFKIQPDTYHACMVNSSPPINARLDTLIQEGKEVILAIKVAKTLLAL